MPRSDPDFRPRRRRRETESRGSYAGWIVFGSVLLICVIAAAVLAATGAFKTSSSTSSGDKSPSTETPLSGLLDLDKPDHAQADRWIGRWEYYYDELPGTKMTVDIRKEGTLELLAYDSGKRLPVERANWKVVRTKKDQITIELQWVGKTRSIEWQIDFLSDDEFRLTFLSSNSRQMTYHRVGTQPVVPRVPIKPKSPSPPPRARP